VAVNCSTKTIFLTIAFTGLMEIEVPITPRAIMVLNRIENNRFIAYPLNFKIWISDSFDFYRKNSYFSFASMIQNIVYQKTLGGL
jgi:hypothetical protein